MVETNLPILFLRDVVLLPYNELRIEVSSELEKRILDISERRHDNHILFINLNDTVEERPNTRKLPKMGVLGKVKTKLELPNGIIRLVVVGIDRVEVLNYIENDDNTYEAFVIPTKEYDYNELEANALRRILLKDLNDYKISGYISLPEITRSNRNHITTIINGRVVKNTTLYRVVNEAYSNYKEDTRYPICVIIMECDPSLLDVNIHPSKLDIRFSNFDELNKLIKETIDKALRDKLLIPTINITKVKENDIKYENLTLDIERNKMDMVSEETFEYKSKLNNLVNYRDENLELEELEETLDGTNGKDVIIQEEGEKLLELYPVGLLLGTYIVCENEQGIYLIDQHAAKERVNYEKVKYALSHPNGNTIRPLVPIVMELPKNEYLVLKENMNILDELRIEIEEFGVSSVRVVSHPTWFTTGYEAETFKRIVELILNREKDFSLERFNDNLAKMVSCKMSIKANTYIDKPSMESLINDLRKCKNPYNCPHGRPAIIHFSIYELEKMFKRSI